jgi:hypothetical protein
MAKTRFSGFSVKKQEFQGLICKNPGLKHNYGYKLDVFDAKVWALDCGCAFLKGQGLNCKNQGLICMGFIWWKDRHAITEKVRDSLEILPAQP